MDLYDIIKKMNKGKYKPEKEEEALIKKFYDLGIVNKNKDKQGNDIYKINKNIEIKEIDMYRYKIKIYPQIKYAGLFFNDDSNLLNCKSNNKIRNDNFHCTIAMSPKDEYLKNINLGNNYDVNIQGRGYDDENEGFKILIPEEIEKIYKNKNTPHITLGTSENGKPFNTGKLDFNQDEKGNLTGKLGVYTDFGIFYDYNKLKNTNKTVKVEQKADEIALKVENNKNVTKVDETKKMLK
ncbi:MAG: hypothetical protein ACOCRX_12430 [Candidatus Woesearchaeota archaeon]